MSIYLIHIDFFYIKFSLFFSHAEFVRWLIFEIHWNNKMEIHVLKKVFGRDPSTRHYRRYDTYRMVAESIIIIITEPKHIRASLCVECLLSRDRI